MPLPSRQGVNHIEIGNCAKQIERMAGDPTQRQRASPRKTAELFRKGERVAVIVAVLRAIGQLA